MFDTALSLATHPVAAFAVAVVAAALWMIAMFCPKAKKEEK